MAKEKVNYQEVYDLYQFVEYLFQTHTRRYISCFALSRMPISLPYYYKVLTVLSFNHNPKGS
ncbi:hypothetical protein [Bacteroides ilei]|uniref:hypothetical protein n=1 Tax=Bacteroides ilei TaxID=1907658 RepID=UPI0013A66185|nr:hypothetical protein [Bacteroides ilei]